MAIELLQSVVAKIKCNFIFLPKCCQWSIGWFIDWHGAVSHTTVRRAWLVPKSLVNRLGVRLMSGVNRHLTGLPIALRLLANRFTFRWSLTTPRRDRASLVNQMSTRSAVRAPDTSNGPILLQFPQYFRCQIIFHLSSHCRNIIVIISFTHVREYPWSECVRGFV